MRPQLKYGTRLRNSPETDPAGHVADLPVAPSHHRTLARLGGWGAILSGTATLLTVGYTFGYLAALGLSVEMLDTPAALLPWIARHADAYLGLWWFFLLSLLFLVPVPLAVYGLCLSPPRAIALVGAAAGLGGIVVGLVGTAAITTSAPLLARSFEAASGAERSRILLLSELAGALGLHLRLFAYLLLALWIGASASVLPGGTAQSGWRNWLLCMAATFVLTSAAAKLLGLFDLEPVLGAVLALAYFVLGFRLLRGNAESRLPMP